MRVALGVSGGVAAYKAAELVRRLQLDRIDVQVVMTRSAQEFVAPLTFAALTGQKVITDLFGGEGPEGSANLDSAIEDNFKASIKAHNNLDDQSIQGTAKNGTLVLKGTVKTREQKKEAGSLAKKVPNVQQVVNELEVKPNKHSTANS